MQITAYRTPIIQPGDDLFTILDTFLPPLSERAIVAITSKIVSFCQGRLVPAENKSSWIASEADHVFPITNPFDIQLTLIHGMILPTAGIDESNGNGQYVLYPTDIDSTTKAIWTHLREKHNLKELGVILTDSHSTPLRWGVMGFALSWYGFQPLYGYQGKEDLFGRQIRFSQANVVDALAVAAVLAMGEGDEQTPLAVINEVDRILFTDQTPDPIAIPMEEDLYFGTLYPI